MFSMNSPSEFIWTKQPQIVPSQMMQKTIRSAISAEKTRSVYILVMGLTGAGKSTFISAVTGNKNIPVGEAADMDGVTQEVQDYVLFYQHNGTSYEVHLIDSPGFDDGTLGDAEVLRIIALYVNTQYRLKHRLAGVLYLHDITKTKMGSIAQRNLRMLEEMVGMNMWNNCTLVTTKWGCTNNPEDEEARENTLRVEEKYFGPMLQGVRKAKMMRFEPKSQESALAIIEPYLNNKFTPQISTQMVDPKGPKLALGKTEAGKIVADNLENNEYDR